MEGMSKLKPNTARMWDYVMGGVHNFGVDRAAVKMIRKVASLYDEGLRLQRRFLQQAVTYMAREKGLDKFLDFGSGLPTRGNVHEIVQAINPNAKVIYSDNDPIVVAFGQEILGETPNVRYVYCDAAEPRTLLDSPVVTELFGNDRRVGIGFIGIFPYIPDEPLARFFTTMHEWADEGSYIAITATSREASKMKGAGEGFGLFEKLGLRLYPRSEQEILDIIGPWRLTEHGLAPLGLWGSPEDDPKINEVLKKSTYNFVVYK